MRLPRWLRFRRSLATALVGAALVGFVTANLGIPLIVPTAQVAGGAGGTEKDKSVPFPCQDRPCGCLSADACMRSCCCFSAEERLAWFRARNITPLPELIAAAKAEGHADSHGACEHCAKAEQKSPAGNCCTTKKTTPAVVGPHAVCASDKSNETAASSSEHKGWRVVVVIGSFAAKCHGMGPWSVTGVLAIPLAAEVTYAFDWSSAEDVSVLTQRFLSAIHSPATRPPCC